MNTNLPIILGSSSPHRQRLLRESDIEFEVMTPDIDEKEFGRRMNARMLTAAVARGKRDALAPRLAGRTCVLITADQVTLADGRILGKPADAEEARRWLLRYGRHVTDLRFVTSVLVTRYKDGEAILEAPFTDIARMKLRPFNDAEVEALLLRGKVLGVCGAVTSEEPLFQAHVEWVRTSSRDEEDARTSVIGLPIKRTLEALNGIGAL